MTTRTALITLSSFMSKVDMTGDCWLWTGALNGSGYGQFMDGSPKGIGAHRYAYTVFHGEPDRAVRHMCRNRSCIKPTHLTTGSHQDNMRDKFFDGTGNTQKLSVESVREIRSRFVRYSANRTNRRELAEEFGIHPKYVQRVAEGRVLSYVQ